MSNVIIRKATAEDIPAIAAIYDEIHDREEAGEVTTGWLRGVYPVKKTAEDAVARGDMYVQVVSGDDPDTAGQVVGTAILNQLQVDVLAVSG